MYSTRAFCKKRPEFGHCVSQRHNVIMLWRNVTSWCHVHGNVTSWCHVHGDGCLQTPVVYDYPFNYHMYPGWYQMSKAIIDDLCCLKYCTKVHCEGTVGSHEEDHHGTSTQATAATCHNFCLKVDCYLYLHDVLESAVNVTVTSVFTNNIIDGWETRTIAMICVKNRNSCKLREAKSSCVKRWMYKTFCVYWMEWPFSISSLFTFWWLVRIECLNEKWRSASLLFSWNGRL